MSSQQSETIILIGDPDYDILNVLRQHYESLDYLVFTTRSMYEINQFFGHLTIDVIIIDTSLHGYEGKDDLLNLKFKSPNSEIILISDEVSTIISQEKLEIVKAIIPKPLSVDLLDKLIVEVINNQNGENMYSLPFKK